MGSSLSEDVILNEQRTTELERRAIHEGTLVVEESPLCFFNTIPSSTEVRGIEEDSTLSNGQTAERGRGRRRYR